jgi:hypothetical protein
MWELWDLYCNDQCLGTVDTFEKAEEWLDKMQAADTEQEFTWSFTKRPTALTEHER